MNDALPRGFRDILPTEARELHTIERALMSAFAQYGYVPLEPPTVEFAQGAITVDERRTVRFLDRDGRLLALRPDVTTAVARVVAQRYRRAEAPLRLAYFTPIFREEASMRGSEREYDQAGVELIGDPTLRADAEVIALLAGALAQCGLAAADIDIDIGHVGFVDGFISELTAEARDAVGIAARSGDLVGTVSLARAAGMSPARIAALERGLRHRSSDLEAPRTDAPDRSRLALDTLAALRPLLEAAGVGGAIRFDLGFVPALPYYTGVVFQVTVPGLGFPIATGGRYDSLLARFGADRAATGFGIAIPHLHQALVAGGWQARAEPPLLLLAPADGDDAMTLRVAAALRAAGIAVAIGAVAESAGQAVRRARVIDGGHLEYDGAVRAIEAVVAALTGGASR
ncbi:MAG: ATP phosphoribosyltransferase regulatory subunit [Candidatus Limnocylindria bacterium]